MSEPTSVAALTETMLQHKLVEQCRELKRRVDSLRVDLWTILDDLDKGNPIQPTLTVNAAIEVDRLTGQIDLAEAMLKHLQDPNVQDPNVRVETLRNGIHLVSPSI